MRKTCKLAPVRSVDLDFGVAALHRSGRYGTAAIYATAVNRQSETASRF